MATFFMISGFLGIMLYRRYGTRRFLGNRMRNLAVPLISSLLLLNPVTLLLVFRYHNAAAWPDAGFPEVWQALNGSIPARGRMVWQLHLWFLFSLIAYICCVPLVSGGAARLAAWLSGLGLIGWRGGVRVPSVLAFGVTGLIVTMVVLLRLAGPQVSETWLIRATLVYSPFFLLGMMFFCSEFLWQAAQRVDLPLLAVLVLLMAVQQLVPLSGTIEGALSQVVLALQRCWISFALLALFHRWIDRRNDLSDLLSRSIYTVYLFHYLIIYLLATLWVQVLPMDKTAFVAISVATAMAGILLHSLVIERIPLLNFLFNGKLVAKAEAVRKST